MRGKNSKKMSGSAADHDLLFERFRELTRVFKDYLNGVKTEFDHYDSCIIKEKGRMDFLQERRAAVFSQLDEYCRRLWMMIERFNSTEYKEMRTYFFKEISPILGKNIEINWHIYKKPYGYPGDFRTMDYIYDYCEGRYLGKSTFEKLINNYTCNIPIARSNIVRKDYFKERIYCLTRNGTIPEVLSIGCGSAREVIELLEEKKDIGLKITLLDLEKDALAHVKKKLEGICVGENFEIEYVQKDILKIIRGKDLNGKVYDLVYIAGLLDYFPNRICRKIMQKAFQAVKGKGHLVVVNALARRDVQRAYYEFLGGWEMLFKTREDLLYCAEGLAGVSKFQFVTPHEDFRYLILSLTKG